MALLSLIMDGPAAAVIGLTGLRVSPHFDRPWKARSVASFWNKHWDLAAGERGACVGRRAGRLPTDADADADAGAAGWHAACSCPGGAPCAPARGSQPGRPAPAAFAAAAGNTLRQLVYDSVCDGSLVPPPPGQPRSRPSASRQLLGSLAAFAASGLAHECIFW